MRNVERWSQFSFSMLMGQACFSFLHNSHQSRGAMVGGAFSIQCACTKLLVAGDACSGVNMKKSRKVPHCSKSKVQDEVVNRENNAASTYMPTLSQPLRTSSPAH